MDPKKIAEFILEKIAGCRFVGISTDNEIFIEFTSNNEALEVIACNVLKENFPKASKVIVVVRPSIEQVTEMVEALNELLEEASYEQPKRPLLDIGEF